jgi:hypothetical protein
MSTLTLSYTVHTYSTGTPGRAICNARTHHFVADDVGGDAVGAGELFLSGISACAVNMVERLARQDHIPLQWMDVCPLYGSVATATEDTSVTLTSHAESRGAQA